LIGKSIPEISRPSGIYPFRASRCFRNELRRVILAFAARNASVLVGFCFGCGAFFSLPTVGIIGSTCKGIIEAHWSGCVLIGPIVGLSWSMVVNAFLPHSFKSKTRRLDWIYPSIAERRTNECPNPCTEG
jgi:hypothetical protein